jgi:hypothetical protein
LEILTLGGEWKETDDTRIPKNKLARLNTVEKIFGSRASLAAASKKEITEGLLSLHAFEEQLRFTTTGGLKNLPGGAFWHENKDNVERVRGSITHLVHDPGDFIIRLHDLLYDKRLKYPLNFKRGRKPRRRLRFGVEVLRIARLAAAAWPLACWE